MEIRLLNGVARDHQIFLRILRQFGNLKKDGLRPHGSGERDVTHNDRIGAFLCRGSRNGHPIDILIGLAGNGFTEGRVQQINSVFADLAHVIALTGRRKIADLKGKRRTVGISGGDGGICFAKPKIGRGFRCFQYETGGSHVKQ